MIELAFEDTHFQDIKNGKKTTIGKIDVDLPGIKKGATVVFFKDVGNKSNSSERISVKVKDIKKFTDIPTMLKEMKLKSILPRSKSYKDGEKVFEETYGNRLKDAKFIAFTFDILENKKNGNTNADSNVVSNEAIHPGPRIKNKKNGNTNGNTNTDTNEAEHPGPRIKNKKNGNTNGTTNTDTNEAAHPGPRIKNKKNGNTNGNTDRAPREFELTVRDPWFSLIENGQKTVEGRLFKGIFQEFKVNDTIRFINKMNGKDKSVTVKITKLTKYPNFGDLLFNEKLYKVLPGLPNIKCGILVYNKIYTNFNEIKEFGTLAIEMKVI